MVPVSNGWAAAHKQTLLPEMFIEIIYGATDPGLREDASVTVNDKAYFSDVSNLVSGTNRKREKVGTLEQGLWGLDGSYTYLDGSPDNPGYVSGAISNAACQFTGTIPTITISFSELRSDLIPGLMFKWSTTYNEWATDYRVTTYRGDIVVSQTTVKENTSPDSVAWLTMSGYNRITIEILGWSLPYHRARCEEIFLGMQTVYTKTDLMGYTHSQSVDLLSAALPKNEITFKLRNEDNRWNPDNPIGNEQYLQARQEIKVRYGMEVDGEVEWIKGGTFWLSEWNTPSNGLEASFTARDALEFMGEEYAGVRSGTLAEIAKAAFVQADLPILETGEDRYVIDPILENYTTDFSGENASYTVAQILQMVAHAGNCVFWQDRDGIVRIAPWNITYSGYIIDQNISYTHPEYDFNKPLKAISVGYGADQRAIVQIAGSGGVQTIDNKLLLTEEDALRVAGRAAEILGNRKTISGEFRADVRLDALDPIIVTSKYSSNIIAVTDITYSTTGGAWKGNYVGRVVSLTLEPETIYLGEIRAGEI